MKYLPINNNNTNKNQISFSLKSNKCNKSNISIFLIFLFSLSLVISPIFSLESKNKKSLLKKNSFSSNNKQTDIDKKISTFLIQNDQNNSALINFKIKKSPLKFILGISPEKKFIISNNQNFNNLEITENKEVKLKATSLSINSLNLKGDFKYNKIAQWKLFSHDSFIKNHTSLNWNFDKTTKCKFFNILGGNCQTSNSEISKEFSNLPEHKEIKVVSSYHFIGNWDSHTGFLKLDGLNFRRNNPQYVWTDRCITDNKVNLELCDYKICKMNSPVNVSVFHTGNYLKLIFGSTLTRNSCEQSFGISDVKVYIR